MRGDAILVEAHHEKAARAICEILLPRLANRDDRFVLTVAGESGSGKSETATAIGQVLAEYAIPSFLFQQDDYFVYPPKSNDRARRADIGWVGSGEVRLDLMDRHLKAFRDGATSLTKPLVLYGDDTIVEETVDLDASRVAIAEGTYTTLLEQVDLHIFIDRNFDQTRAHREKRRRDDSELDVFIDRVLTIEHEIISAQKSRAQIIIHADYTVSTASN